MPIKGGTDLPKNFQRCDLSDRARGVFTLYLSIKPKEYAFYGQVAHEIAHILNIKLFDCYVEGLNMVFAEKLLKKEGKDWNGWSRYFKRGNDPLYGNSYFMMKEIHEVADKRNMKTFLRHATYTDRKKNRMHINIDAWIDTLPFSKRKSIKAIIKKHAPNIKKAMVNDPYKNTFTLPTE